MGDLGRRIVVAVVASPLLVPGVASAQSTNTALRAPNQLPRAVNSFFNAPPTFPRGPQEPSFRYKPSDFWAQGLNVGLAFRF